MINATIYQRTDENLHSYFFSPVNRRRKSESVQCMFLNISDLSCFYYLINKLAFRINKNLTRFFSFFISKH